LNDSELPAEVVQIKRSESIEGRDQKLASLSAIWETACEMLPDETLNPHEMKFVYYGVTSGGYNPKYGRLRVEVTYQIWLKVEHSSDVFFPGSVQEIARKYINEQGFLNTLNVYRRILKKHVQRNHWADFYLGRVGSHVKKEKLLDIVEQELGEFINMNIEELEKDGETIDDKSDRLHRNAWDRIKRDKQKGREEEEKPILDPLLVKKRSKNPAPSSIRHNVKRLTEEGFGQAEIARKLDISERRVRQLQKEKSEDE
jgi:hypothetical protein